MAQINRDSLGCMSLENIHLCTLYSITRYIRGVREKLSIYNSETERVCRWILIAALRF